MCFDIAALDPTDAELIAGCTMTSSMATFQTLIAEAFAADKVTFKTTETAIKVGVAFNSSSKSSRGNVVAASDVAAVVYAGDKIAAAALDCIEQTFTVEEGALVAGENKGSKAEQGEGYYVMPAGTWKAQSLVFANAFVGKTAAELDAFEGVSDALAAAGCTMQNGDVYKAVVVKAAGYAR